MPNANPITPRFFAFLTDLAAHNEREWFAANKARYEADVRDPFLQLLTALAARVGEFDAGVVVDPRPVGGSMFRIHRDIRFSKDKRPYKTAVAAHFGHATHFAQAASYYLHLAPGECMTGAGVWHPEPPQLAKIRDAIAADPDGWRQASSGQHFGSACGLIGESLQRPPKGYDPQHPAIEDIKRKDFAISQPLSEADVCGEGFVDTLVDAYRAARPFVGFLNHALAAD